MIEYIVRVTCDRCDRVAYDHRPNTEITEAEDAYAALRAELPGWELHLPDGPHVCGTCAGPLGSRP